MKKITNIHHEYRHRHSNISRTCFLKNSIKSSQSSHLPSNEDGNTRKKGKFPEFFTQPYFPHRFERHGTSSDTVRINRRIHKKLYINRLFSCSSRIKQKSEITGRGPFRIYYIQDRLAPR